MFKVADERIVEDWPVDIRLAQSGGKTTTHRVHLSFRVLDQDALQELLRESGDDVELLRQVVTGWREGDVADGDGNPMPFNDENLTRFAKIPSARSAAIRAYYDEVLTGGGARKN